MSRTRQSRAAAPGSNQMRLGGRTQFTMLAALSGVRAQFLDAMRNSGIVPANPDAIMADGCLHRFDVDGDKPHRRNGWAILHVDGIPAGKFGTWKGDVSVTWCAGHGRVSDAQRERFAAQIERAKRERNAERWAAWRHTQARAVETWAKATTPTTGHGYLVAKAVGAYGIRQLHHKLIVPLRDGDGELWNVQTITEDGTKRFLSGGRKRGLYHAIGGPVGDALLIAEGYATAASLFECEGTPVAVAFDCGNLVPVAKTLRAKYPHARITLCADNDMRVEGNPGLTKAREAAAAIGGHVAMPPGDFNDFNDALREVKA